ncbi:MAG: hypothetical protein ABGY75_03690, partial [Gemmataceae bacterium]
MVLAGKDYGRAQAPELGQITPFEQIAGRIMDPENHPAGLRHQGQQLVAPVGDVKITGVGQAVIQRRPVDAIPGHGCGAAIADMHIMATRCQRLG